MLEREGGKFLGTYIKRIDSNKGPPVFARHSRSNVKRRNPTGNLWMTAPILELVKKLSDRKLLDLKGTRLNPKPIKNFTVLPVRDIIFNYKSIILGTLNHFFHISLLTSVRREKGKKWESTK